MSVTKPIHEVKDHLSQLVAEVAATGQEVHITRHGKVVARLVPPAPPGVILGLGARPGAEVPGLDELRWSRGDLAEMLDGSPLPS